MCGMILNFTSTTWLLEEEDLHDCGSCHNALVPQKMPQQQQNSTHTDGERKEGKGEDDC